MEAACMAGADQDRSYPARNEMSRPQMEPAGGGRGMVQDSPRGYSRPPLEMRQPIVTPRSSEVRGSAPRESSPSRNGGGGGGGGGNRGGSGGGGSHGGGGGRTEGLAGASCCGSSESIGENDNGIPMGCRFFVSEPQKLTRVFLASAYSSPFRNNREQSTRCLPPVAEMHRSFAGSPSVAKGSAPSG